MFFTPQNSAWPRRQIESYAWAQFNRCLIITFDEDFADQRSFPVGQHFGIVRLRVWPTTAEETEDALDRLLAQTIEDELTGALVIVDRSHIRIRPAKKSS